MLKSSIITEKRDGHSAAYGVCEGTNRALGSKLPRQFPERAISAPERDGQLLEGLSPRGNVRSIKYISKKKGICPCWALQPEGNTTLPPAVHDVKCFYLSIWLH